MHYTKPIHLTIIKKYQALHPGISDDEAIALWKLDLKAIGSKGGKAGNTGGFQSDPERAAWAGRLGGLKSRRSKKGV